MEAEFLKAEMSQNILEEEFSANVNDEIETKSQKPFDVKVNLNILKSMIQESKSQTSIISMPMEDVKDILAHYAPTPNDTKDPSYTQLTVPYRVVCRLRYKNAQNKQIAQFIKEIKAHELMRDTALDGVRIHREFCQPIISSLSAKERIRLTAKQREQIDRLMNDR